MPQRTAFAAGFPAYNLRMTRNSGFTSRVFLILQLRIIRVTEARSGAFRAIYPGSGRPGFGHPGFWERRMTMLNVSARLALAAAGFALSDVSVARDRFGRESFLNRLWGLPLYYGAQCLFAVSV